MNVLFTFNEYCMFIAGDGEIIGLHLQWWNGN